MRIFNLWSTMLTKTMFQNKNDFLIVTIFGQNKNFKKK